MSKADEVALRITQYNRRIDMIQVLITKLLYRYESQPPIARSWVIMDGQRLVSWSIRYPSDYCGDNINLLPDGRLVLVKAAASGRDYNYDVSGVVMLAPVNDHDPKYPRGNFVSLETLTHLCRNMIGLARARGISIDPSWDRFSHRDWDGSDKPPSPPRKKGWPKPWLKINRNPDASWRAAAIGLTHRP